MEIGHTRSAGGKRIGDRGSGLRWAVAEEAPASTSAADLGSRRASVARASDQRFNGWSSHTRSQALSVVPFFGDVMADAVPIGVGESLGSTGATLWGISAAGNAWLRMLFTR